MYIEGKAAVITGGGTGVGRATALDLARRGCAVLINYSRSKDEAEQTAADAAAFGVKAIAVQADVAEDADCRRMVETAEREFGRLKMDYGLAPLRCRGLERVALHADLVMLGRLAQALSRAREQAVLLAA